MMDPTVRRWEGFTEDQLWHRLTHMEAVAVGYCQRVVTDEASRQKRHEWFAVIAECHRQAADICEELERRGRDPRGVRAS